MAIDPEQLQQILEAALQANAAQQAQAIQAAVAAVVQQAAPQQQQPAGAAVPFAEVPGEAGGLQPWDFAPKGDGVKLFKSATQPLEDKFDGTQQSLSHFLNAINRRGASYGWTPVLSVPDDTGATRSLITEYGTLNAANVRAHAATYQAQLSRTRQAATCLRICIENSVEPAFSDRLNQHKASYTISVDDPMNPPANPGDPHPQREAVDGALMLFKLISIVSIETRSTVANITKQLNNLPVIMEKSKNDIEKFNIKVNDLMSELRARDATVPDLITNLFEAYKAAGDSQFVSYFFRKEESYEDGTIATLSEAQLMTMAHEKYKTISDRQEWMKKTDHELEFIALKAKVDLYEARPTGSGKNRLTQTRTLRNRDTQPAVSRNNNNSGSRNTGKYAWKSVAPKPDEPTRKEWEGKWYIYCPHHGDTKWVLEVSNRGKHVEGCQALAAANATDHTGAPANVAMQATTSDDLRMARAMAHIMHQDGCHDEE